MKTNTKMIFLFGVLIFVDQIAKYLFYSSICNQNIAWNIPIPQVIFYLVWIAIIAGLIYSFLKSKSFYQKMVLIFIFSGAISNMIDRIRLGCVVDYIDLKIFPVFNLADVYITIGVIAFLALVLKSKNKKLDI